MSPRNRRLVPMPPKRVPVDEPPPPSWSDNLAAKIRSTPPWILFAWLAATAVAYAFLGKFILLIAAIVLLIRLWWWGTHRFPRTFVVINFLIAAMCNSGRRRRW